ALPSGTIRLAGSVRYDTKDKRPLMQAALMQGEISSNSLAVNSAAFRGDVRDLRARFRLADGNFEAKDLHAVLLGGTLNGNLKLDDITGRSRGVLRASLKGISLAQVKAVSTSPSLRNADVSGGINADAAATWEGSMQNLVARANANINAALGAAAASKNGQRPVPLNGILHATYQGRSGEITLAQSYVRTQQTSINLNGT